MASAAATARLQKERKDWRKEHPANFIAKPSQSADGSTNLFKWECKIPGKENSVWAGGMYTVILDFPPNYPIEPPIASFRPPLFHPNIFSNGQVCLSILKTAKEWVPGITIPQILLGLQNLLDAPNTKDPANWEAAQLLETRPQEYNRRARDQASKYKPKEEPDEE